MEPRETKQRERIWRERVKNERDKCKMGAKRDKAKRKNGGRVPKMIESNGDGSLERESKEREYGVR